MENDGCLKAAGVAAADPRFIPAALLCLLTDRKKRIQADGADDLPVGIFLPHFVGHRPKNSVISAVGGQQHNIRKSMADITVHIVLHQSLEHLRAQGKAAGVVHMVYRQAGTDEGGHQSLSKPPGHPFAHGLADDVIGALGQMGAMLLVGGGADQHRVRPIFHGGPDLRPGHFLHKNALHVQSSMFKAQ